MLTLALTAGPATATTDATDLAIRLQPASIDARGAVPFVDVSIVMRGIKARKGAAAFGMPIKIATARTEAGQITGLSAEDDRGPLPLATEDTTQGPDDQRRQWRVGRDAAGTIHVHYRVTLDPDKPLSGGPMFEMRTGQRAFSGAGLSFLVLPTDTTPRTVSITWDLPDASSKAASSLGFGNVVSTRPLTPTQVGNTFFMEGDLGQYHGTHDRFLGAWTGRTPFAADPVMQWTEALRRFYETFFADAGRPFVVFTRPNPSNPGSGLGLTDSFAFTYGPKTTAQDIHFLLAHEMVHTEIPPMKSEASDPDSLAHAWFEEGIAVYYQDVLPLRAGLIDHKAFLEDLNAIAAQYFTNSKRDSSNAQAAAGFWLDSRLRLLPYNRGALYFAKLNATIRTRSNGKRSLDDVIHTLLSAHRSGKSLDEALWRKVLFAEAGAQGVADYEAMLRGDLVLPPSEAYGACFRRVVRKTRPFDLGFATGPSLIAPIPVGRIIPGSAAEKAGLREGDVVIKGAVGDSTTTDPHMTVTFKVKRGGQTFDVTYLPRGEPVDTYQWEETHAAGCDAPPHDLGSMK